MPRTILRENLERLQRELAEGPELDPEGRALLAEEERDAPDSLVERLRSAADRFEESHPALTVVVGRLADALANLGI